jgi:hypothetical protein
MPPHESGEWLNVSDRTGGENDGNNQGRADLP